MGPSVLVIAVLSKRLRREEQRLLALLLAIAGGQILYCIYVGGDAWETYQLPNRYLTPAVVLVLLGACLTAFSGFAQDSATGTWPERWRLVYGIAIVATAGPVLVSGLLLASGHLGNRGSGTAALKGALTASVVCAAVVAVGYVLASRYRFVSWTVLAAVVTLCLLVGVAPEAATQVNSGQKDGGASRFALLGSQLAQVTTHDAVIAVTGAGASQYFSGRSMVDLYGKSDKHIAKGPIATDAFKPGHNKWDLVYSVGRLKPDVVAQSPTQSYAQLRAYGYVPMRLREGTFNDAIAYAGESVIYVRSDSPNVRFERLVPVGPSH